MIMKKDPFKNLVLTAEEKEIEESFERGEYVSAPNFPETKKMLEEAAENHIELKKTKQISIRIMKMDLVKLKTEANEMGIGYQTLIKIILHEYIERKDVNR